MIIAQFPTNLSGSGHVYAIFMTILALVVLSIIITILGQLFERYCINTPDIP